MKYFSKLPRPQFILAPAILAVSQLAYSSPAIEDHSVKISESSNGKETISITLRGEGFGEKKQAEPVLWIFGNDIRQNGKRLDNPTFEIGRKVDETGPSIWSRVYANVTYDSLARYEGLEHSYFTGQNGTVRNPLAFGGKNPPYSKRTYLSARIKPTGPIHNYRGIAYSDLSGTFNLGDTHFDVGEEITIKSAEGTHEGNIIGIDKEAGIATIIGIKSSSKSKNAVVTGKDSGATLKLHSDEDYQNPLSSKYFRMTSGGKAGMYTTMSGNRILSGYYDTNLNLSEPLDVEGNRDYGYGIPNMASNTKWRLLEVGIDQSGSTAAAYLDIDNQNRRYQRNIDLEGIKLNDRSPTISQLGWDAAGGRKDVHVGLHFGEIYFDTTPQRVMISSESEYTEAGNELELQYPTKWSDEEIVFELRSGALDPNDDLFIYVFDKTSSPNNSGYPICITCSSRAPEQTSIQVN